MVKEFEGDARSILSKLHYYHTQSNAAQHEVLTLTTYITYLSLTDSWNGTIRQFLSHFKKKFRLLDSLVPDTDKIPETVRITFLHRAEQQNHDLRQIHVLDSVWRSKTGSTGKFTFEVNYDLLWNVACQHDLNKATKQTQRKAFISHQNDPCDDLEYDPEEEDSTHSQNQDESQPYPVFQSSFNPTGPKKATKVFILSQLWGEFPEAAKKMVIDYNKKIKVVSPKPYSHDDRPKPKPNLGKPNKSIYMRRMILQEIRSLKLLPKLWYMNV